MLARCGTSSLRLKRIHTVSRKTTKALCMVALSPAAGR